MPSPKADVRGHEQWHSRAVVDTVLMMVIALIELGVTALAAAHQDRGDLGVAGVTLLLLGVAALPWRHRYPVAVLVWVFATTLAYQSLGYPRGPVFLALIVAFGQVVLVGRRRAAIATIVVGFVLFLWLGPWIGREPDPELGQVVALLAWLLVLLTAAELLRSRRDRVREAARREAEAHRRRVTDERLRIARDLHDAVAHNLSLINIQAGVALHLADEPDRAREALATIKDASKEALVELRSIVGVLRQVDEDAPRAPTPSLARLDDLVSNAAAAGVEVHVEVDGDLGTVSRNTDLAAFRIVQESLTNVARHSNAGEAVVRLRAGKGTLSLEVLDEGTGRGAGAGLPGGGNGITGMRERAASVGGTFDAGRRPGRGFAVRADLPLVAPDPVDGSDPIEAP
jgi:signal transduction histidine kinase